MRLNIFVAGLAALLLAMPAAAAPAATTGASQEAAAASFQDWMRDITLWNGQYTALLHARITRFEGLLSGAEQLSNLLSTGKQRQARGWAETWAAGQKSGFAADYDAFTALPPHPPAVPAMFANEPMAVEMASKMENVRDRVGVLLMQTQQSGERYIDLVVAASSGRPNDLQALGSGTFTVMATHLQAENLLMENTRGKVGEPNFYYATAMLESNSAMVDWALANEQRMLGKEVDLAAVASSMRGHSGAAHQASEDLVVAADQAGRTVNTEPGLRGTPLLVSLNAVLDNLREAAGVEGQVADAMGRLATALEQSSDAGQQAVTEDVSRLIDQRLALFSQRQALLSGSGG